MALLVLATVMPAVAQVSVGTYIGAVQPTYARQGRVWGAGLATGGRVGIGVSERWRLNIALDWHRLWDDTTSVDAVKFPRPDARSSRAWTTTMLSGAIEYRPTFLQDIGSFMYLGAGIATWRVESYPGYESITVPAGSSAGTFAASELALLGGIGIEPHVVSNVSARVGLSVDGFTGLGASLPDGLYDDRTRVHVGFNLGFVYHFGSNPLRGHVGGAGEYPLPVSEQTIDVSGMMPESEYPDLSTVDSLMPGPSQRELYSTFLSNLSQLPDGDRDGIPDDNDKCQDTPEGYTVDECGCLEMTRLDRRFILNVQYSSGWSDIDPLSSRILDDLAIRLRDSIAFDILIEGFTDNVGTDMANLLLSQKRATRVKDYLVSRGIAAVRINAVGRGETNFIADNATQEGRRRNRRIELSFTRHDAVNASMDDSD